VPLQSRDRQEMGTGETDEEGLQTGEVAVVVTVQEDASNATRRDILLVSAQIRTTRTLTQASQTTIPTTIEGTSGMKRERGHQLEGSAQ
jgi:hypothetical protein